MEILVIKLCERSHAPEDPEIWLVIGRQVYGSDEVGGVSGGGEGACSGRGAVQRAFIGV